MKLIKTLFAVLMILLLMQTAVGAAGVQFFYDGAYHDYTGNIFNLRVNNKPLLPEMPPIVFSDYSVVPARSVFQDGLGATVEWDARLRQVTVTMNDTELILTIDKTTARLNGKLVEIPIAPKIINDYTMIPARFVGESLGMFVDFENDTDTIVIDSLVNKVTVTDVTYKEKSDTKGVLTVSTDSDELKYSEFLLKDPLRLVIDVKDGVFEKIPSVIEVGNGNLDKIRFGQQASDARIVIDLTEDLGYVVKQKGSEIIITLTIDPNAAPDATETPDATSKPTEEPDKDEKPVDIFKRIEWGYEGGQDYVILNMEFGEPVLNGNLITVPIYGNLPAEEQEQIAKGNFMQKLFYTPAESGESGILTVALSVDTVKISEENGEIRIKTTQKPPARSVTLDAGHGGQDGGAVGYYEDGSIKALEKEFNLDVALRAQALLEAQGVAVHMIRTDDTYVDYLKVGGLANDAGTSLFVSIHTNSAIVEQAHGIETYGYLENGNVLSGMNSSRFSQILLDELIDQTGAYSRGVKDGKTLAVVNSTKMPATLIEIGFISNAEECELMMMESYRQKLAQAVCNGVLKAFEEMGI